MAVDCLVELGAAGVRALAAPAKMMARVARVNFIFNDFAEATDFDTNMRYSVQLYMGGFR